MMLVNGLLPLLIKGTYLRKDMIKDLHDDIMATEKKTLGL